MSTHIIDAFYKAQKQDKQPKRSLIGKLIL